MKDIQYKSLLGETADVDKSSRTVVVYFSKFGNKDLDGDIIVSGAFAKTIAERGPKGTNEIFHLFNHRSDIKNVLGKPRELYEDGYGLKAVTKFLNTPEADSVLEGYESGVYNQHSIGFRVIKWQVNEAQNAYELTELKLYEGSTVLWGANPNTPFLGFSKSLEKDDYNKYVEELIASYENTIKKERKSALSPELEGISNLQFAQIKSLLREFAAQSAVEEQRPPLGTSVTNPLKDLAVGKILKQSFLTSMYLKNHGN